MVLELLVDRQGEARHWNACRGLVEEQAKRAISGRWWVGSLGRRMTSAHACHWLVPPPLTPILMQREAEFLSDGRVLVKTKLTGRYSVQVSDRHVYR